MSTAIETINGVEICQTMGNNPDDPPEQHATGRRTVWWRMDTEWFAVDLPIDEVQHAAAIVADRFKSFTWSCGNWVARGGRTGKQLLTVQSSRIP